MAWLAPAIAHAGHDMATMTDSAQSEVAVGVSVVAATYDNMAYVGSYQGISPTASWMRGRFAALASVGLYHLEQNGLDHYGLGDVSLGGHVALLQRPALDAGVALHVMLPTGSEIDNLGMGHTMAMPSAWASWRAAPVTLSASAGYARALVDLGGMQHDHGPSPLVDPMNLQELTWSAGADVQLAHGLALGGRALGGIPIGKGRARVIGGGRVGWGTPRVTTAFELQLGVAGDPFTVRGVVETALRF